MFLLAISNPLSWGEWGAGLAQTMGLEVVERFAWMDLAFFQVAPGICFQGGEVYVPQAVVLAPGVSFIFLVPPGRRISWADKPITWEPLDVVIQFAQCLYAHAAEPRRNAMKTETYIAIAELLDRTPFAGAYHRALAAHGPLAPEPTEAAGLPRDLWKRPGLGKGVELQLFPEVG